MKKLLFLIISICVLILSGCTAPTGSSQTSENSNYYTVTFRQDGQADICVEVEKNQALTDIPTPVAKTGYTLSWDRTDFSSITEDFIVYAVEQANEYTITFNLYSEWGTVAFDMQSTTLAFDSEYEFSKPSLYGFFFKGWKVEETGTDFAQSGRYSVAEDITLVPTWEKDEDSNRWWGGLI